MLPAKHTFRQIKSGCWTMPRRVVVTSSLEWRPKIWRDNRRHPNNAVHGRYDRLQWRCWKMGSPDTKESDQFLIDRIIGINLKLNNLITATPCKPICKSININWSGARWTTVLEERAKKNNHREGVRIGWSSGSLSWAFEWGLHRSGTNSTTTQETSVRQTEWNSRAWRSWRGDKHGHDKFLTFFNWPFTRGRVWNIEPRETDLRYGSW